MDVGEAVQVRDDAFPVVAVGGSAGGITALQELFAALPGHPGFALVVVQHRLPEGGGKLASLLARWTRMPVREAVDGVRIERDCVFVAPATDSVDLVRGVFAARSREPASPVDRLSTVDDFLESLARDVGSRAIAVILSGTASDGAAGALQVKNAGGIVMVQDPASALHDGMPVAAIASGAADLVVAPRALADQLVACAAPSYVRPTSPTAWHDDVGEALENMIALIRTSAGLDLTGYKTTPLLWRIQHRMQLRRVPLYRDYEALLHDDPAELESLVRSIPIHVTEFFRDPQAWQTLAEQVIPSLLESSESRTLRAWTTACATGEEAYSLAMLLAEETADATPPVDFQLFATDVSAEIVARASRGIFKPDAVRAISPERRNRFLYAADGSVRVQRSLRETMVFAPHDLLTDPPFQRIDLVSCRNLFIYLEPHAIDQVIYRLHSALRMNGILFIGRSESLPRRHQGLEIVVPGSGIYRKVGPAVEPERDRWQRPSRSSASRTSPRVIDEYAQHVAVQEHDVPAVLVDDTLTILRIYGDTRRYLRLAAGEPTFDLLRLVDRDLSIEIEHEARRAFAEDRAVIITGAADPGDGARTMEVRLTPLRTPAPGERRLMVSFVRARDAGELSETDASGWSHALRKSDEELDASREELQALNAELRASNDQLDASNEELSRVNVELAHNLELLATQKDVLSSGAVMTLFLDEALRIRWFTPAITAVLPLTAGDVGRELSHLAPRFSDPALLTNIAAVLGGGAVHENVVRSFAGRWYQLTIRPFQEADQTTSGQGVALTFTDVTDRTRAEQASHVSNAWLHGQRDAFSASDKGAALADSLGILVQTAIELMGPGTRCAFFLVDDAGRRLDHVVGMPDVYADCVDGLSIGPNARACALAVHTGRPVITPDVLQEPRWKRWLGLAKDVDFRACWAFPIETSAGKVVGTFAMYHRDPRDATTRDHELATALTRAAAMIIARHQEATQAPSAL